MDFFEKLYLARTLLAMLTGRFIPIVGGLWIAGLLIEKIYTPGSTGTLRAQGISFGIFLFCVIIILNVLSLFPSLMLGPASDHFLLK